MRGINEKKADYFNRIGKTAIMPKAPEKKEVKKESKKKK
tara:strand:+ start:91 stop:207 length:117 start_codon:yes stop_codon:yes gene_type:complete